MEDITKSEGDEIIVTKTIPEQVIETRYSKKQIRGEIDVCNEKINRLQEELNMVEQRYNQEKGMDQALLDEVKAQKVKLEALLNEAVKLIPEIEPAVIQK